MKLRRAKGGLSAYGPQTDGGPGAVDGDLARRLHAMGGQRWGEPLSHPVRNARHRGEPGRESSGVIWRLRTEPPADMAVQSLSEVTADRGKRWLARIAYGLSIGRLGERR